MVAESTAAWYPTPELLTESNVARFMAAHGFTDFEALRTRSIDDPEWFWDAFVEFIGLPFTTPYTDVLDESRGHRMGHVVHRRPAQHRRRVRRPVVG